MKPATDTPRTEHPLLTALRAITQVDLVQLPDVELRDLGVLLNTWSKRADADKAVRFDERMRKQKIVTFPHGGRGKK